MLNRCASRRRPKQAQRNFSVRDMIARRVEV
jgi:hypothetical protein